MSIQRCHISCILVSYLDTQWLEVTILGVNISGIGCKIIITTSDYTVHTISHHSSTTIICKYLDCTATTVFLSCSTHCKQQPKKQHRIRLCGRAIPGTVELA